MKKTFNKLLFIVLSSTCLLSGDVFAEESYSFGIVPQQSAAKLAKNWNPILSYLSEKSGVTLKFATGKNIPVFEERLLKGEYDFSYMNPYHYTAFNKVPGYEAFGKQKDKQIRGIIVVSEDSGIKELSDLNGKTLAFPSPAAFAASILPRAKLVNDGINFQAKYVSSHDSVYLSVAKGLFAGGGGIQRTFNNIGDDTKDKLRVLWETDPYTAHAFAAHPSIPENVVQNVLDAMLQMNSDPEGIALLKTINFKGVESAEDQNWNDVRELNIELLNEMIAQ